MVVDIFLIELLNDLPLPLLPSSCHLSCFPLLRYTCMYTLLPVVFSFRGLSSGTELDVCSLETLQVLLVGIWTLNSLCHSTFIVSGQVLRNSWSLKHQCIKELFSVKISSIGVVFSSPIILRALQIQIQSFSLRKLGIRSSKAFRSKKGQIPKTYYFTFTVGLFPSLNTIIDEWIWAQKV